jgi:hypothetical protein
MLYRTHLLFSDLREQSPMSPDEALERQIELYRRMTGEERLKIALDLHTFACNVTRAGIRSQRPGATDEEVDRDLRPRIELARSSEPSGSV